MSEVEIAKPARGLRSLLAVASLVVSAGCNDGARLDAAPLHQGPRFELRVVRYYENLPLSYTGEVYRVQCRSDQTAALPAARMHEPGWATVTNGGAIDTTSAAQLAESLRRQFLVLSDDVVIWMNETFAIVTFDACGSFAAWRPSPEVATSFRDVRLEGPGVLSFVAAPAAPTDGKPLRVRTEDAGATWLVAADKP